MVSLKLHLLFCLLCCLPWVRPFHWQDSSSFDFRPSGDSHDAGLRIGLCRRPYVLKGSVTGWYFTHESSVEDVSKIIAKTQTLAEQRPCDNDAGVTPHIALGVWQSLCCRVIHQLPQFDQVDIGGQLSMSVMFHKLQSVMSAARVDHSKIPKGNGSHPVGCTDLMFGYGNESIFLRLYYPAQDQGHHDTVWIPNKEYFEGLSIFLGTPSIVGNILHLLYGSLTAPASWNSPLRTGEKYPLVVFSHGLGAFRTIYSAIGVGLASNGFIVATVEHRDRSASATYYFEDQEAAKVENRSWFYLKKVRQRARECSQALSALLDLEHGNPEENILGSAFDVKQLKDAIDENKIAVIGHSFGGATVIQALSEDQRFKCGIALDPWMYPVSEELYSKVPQPLFFVNSAKFQTPQDIAKMKNFYHPDKERKMITIKGSVHQNFADFTFVTGKIIGNKLTLKGEIDSTVAIDLTNKASLAFLQKHLGLHKDFEQWDSLVEGDNENLIPGSPFDVVTKSPTLQHSPESNTQN